ncbi:hypothetical protein H6F89_14960 [Cyanobacteria bacterium FACHB-63]|nr:hypothetical protein [Cyanobacteria bacterium FACHB-63]
MKNLFNAKWFMFYGGTIAFVIALFSLTTRYGETKLKAPLRISGQYKVTATNLPGCLKSKTLILSIEQSGIYLNGSLLEFSAPTQEQTVSKKKPSLTGVFQQPNLELSGTTTQIAGCEQSTISIQAAIAAGSTATTQPTLKGNLRLEQADAIFAAERQEK